MTHPTRRYTAEITDPVTGEVTAITAATAAELEQAVEGHLQSRYPHEEPSLPPVTGHGHDPGPERIRG